MARKTTNPLTRMGTAEIIGETIRLFITMLAMALFFGAVGFFWIIT